MILDITNEQINLADELADKARVEKKAFFERKGFSDPYLKNKTEEQVWTIDRNGVLAEIIFADLFGLKRPERAFGLDYDEGWDFKITVNGKERKVDVKSKACKLVGDWRPWILIKDQHIKNMRCDCFAAIYLDIDRMKADFVGMWKGNIPSEKKGWAHFNRGEYDYIINRECEQNRFDISEELFDYEYLGNNNWGYRTKKENW